MGRLAAGTHPVLKGPITVRYGSLRKYSERPFFCGSRRLAIAYIRPD